MDLFLATCQGIGLALAGGAVVGAVAGTPEVPGRPGRLGGLLAGLAAVGGGLLFGASLAGAEHPAWPGWPLGAVISLLGFVVFSGVVRGAATRAGEGASASSLAAMVALAAAALAALSLIISPVALAALAAAGWLGVARRRRAQRKYEGLRVLR